MKSKHETVQYYSDSKGKFMDAEEMHMMHLENVLTKDLDEDNLSGALQATLLREYIHKTREERSKLHSTVKAEKVLNNLLFDLVKTDPREVYVPKGEPKAERSKHTNTALLNFYRHVAAQYIKRNGSISADQLRSTLEKLGYTVDGPTLSQVFRTKQFEQIGYRRSNWDGARGRYINRWKLAEAV